jgi:hypothetical protein
LTSQQDEPQLTQFFHLLTAFGHARLRSKKLPTEWPKTHSRRLHLKGFRFLSSSVKAHQSGGRGKISVAEEKSVKRPKKTSQHCVTKSLIISADHPFRK